MAATGQSRGLMLSALALAVFVGAMMWALLGPSDEEPVAPQAAEDGVTADAPSAHDGPAEPEKSGEPEAKAAPAAPKKDAVDLFAGEMPDFMATTHARVLDKKPLGIPDQKELYNFGKEHPQDARPQLLLAWDSMNREWDGIGVRMYKIAYHADPRAKDDPRMLEDLLKVAATHDKVEYRDTTELVREVYGSDAIGPIEEAIEEQRARGVAKNVERLERLRDALTNK